MTGAYPVLREDSFRSRGSARPAGPWTRTFRGVPASVAEGRRFVAGLLAGCPAREVLVACVSELCTNAVTHTASGQGGVFTVEVDLPRDGMARIAVTDDGGPSLPVAGALDPAVLDPAGDGLALLDLMAEGGRGLALVAASTSRWGYVEAGPGLTVWAEACWPVAIRASASQPSPDPAPRGPLGPRPPRPAA